MMTLQSCDPADADGPLQRGQNAIKRLLNARRAAEELQHDLWQFAVDLSSLVSCGICKTDLRWLLCKGFAVHGRELTLPGADQRSFQRTGCLKFTDDSCFVATDLCQSQLSQFANNVVDPALSSRPCWNAETRELIFAGVTIKRFRRPAPNQESVLAALEESLWPKRIDDPMPPQIGKEAKARLHDTINALNRNQREKLIRFSGDGTGEGVCWELRNKPGNE